MPGRASLLGTGSGPFNRRDGRAPGRSRGWSWAPRTAVDSVDEHDLLRPTPDVVEEVSTLGGRRQRRTAEEDDLDRRDVVLPVVAQRKSVVGCHRRGLR